MAKVFSIGMMGACLAAPMVLASPLAKQDHSSHAMPDEARDGPAEPVHRHHAHSHSVSEFGSIPPATAEKLSKAKAFILENYATPEQALAKGWRRPRGATPTMGGHWANRKLIRDDRLDIRRPEVLIFAPVQGEMRLVGASWIRRQSADEPTPDLFEGLEGMWHRHDASDPLNQAMAQMIAGARPGQGRRMSGRGRMASGIVMNHFWFVPAQNGPFTGHNHYLPFLDAALPLPPGEIDDSVLGEAALALGEMNSSADIVKRVFNRLPQDAQADVNLLRDEIAGLAAEYRTAHAAGDVEAITNILSEMGGLWRDIRAIHDRQIPERFGKVLKVAYGNMLSGHAHSTGHSH